MAKVDLNALLSRLNPLCLERLQSAAGLAATRTHHEAGVAHFLLTLVQAPDSDLAFILERTGRDAEALARGLEAVLADLPGGHAARPNMSPELVDVLTTAWLVASLELKETRVRSGAVLAALLRQWAETPGGGVAALFAGFPAEDVLRTFSSLTAGSREQEWGEEPMADMAAPPAEGEALGRFGINYTRMALAGEIDPVFGREEAMRRMVDILARRRRNNPIIVGDPGVGKTALVEGLALRLAQGRAPHALRQATIWGLDLAMLDAPGPGGDLESRLRAMLQELMAASKPVILFLDDAHVLLGGGRGRWGSGSGVLKPVLEQGKLRTIATASWSDYKRTIEKDPALSRCFQPLKLEEPSVEEAMHMLRGIAPRYEAAHGVSIRDDAVAAAAELADRYLTGRSLPDKAVDLLDTAAARVKVNLSASPPVLEDMERAMSELKREIDGLTRDQSGGRDVDESRLEQAWKRLNTLKKDHADLTGRWERERDLALELMRLEAEAAAGDGVDQETAARLEELRQAQGAAPLVRHEVDPDVVARVVSDWTGIPLGKVLREEVSAVLDLELNLRRRIRGQDQALEVITRNIRAAKSGLKDPRQPLGVFLLVGPSGVGKTETALALSDLLFGDEDLVAVNMSEFQERHSVSRLIGSPPGYVGYGEGGVLTDAVRRRPYCLVLLDEAEKAHLEVMNLFYQAFDKGVLADGEGRGVDFRNVIFFLTSNLASERIQEVCRHKRVAPVDDVVAAIRPVLSDHFKPALLARMTIVPYYTLEPWALRQVAALKLDLLAERMRENNRMVLTYEDNVMDVIAARCTETETGARNIDHVLRGELLPRLSEEILARMAEGRPPVSVHVDHNEVEGFVIRFAENGG